LSWERVVSATSIEMATGIFFIDSDITVHIASPDEKFGGDSLQNIVNRLTAGGANGIQIEQRSPCSFEPLAGHRRRGRQRLQHPARMNIYELSM
jgi:hypothetical protein